MSARATFPPPRDADPHLGGYFGLAALGAALALFAATSLGPRPVLPVAGTGESLRPAQAQTQTGAAIPVDYIVKFRDVPQVAEAVKLFRRDPEAAAASFADWAAGQAALEGFRLTGASYSGEAILTLDFPASDPPTRTNVRAAQERLLSHDAVAYADPDYRAQTGHSGGPNR